MTDSLLIYLFCTNRDVKLFLICRTDRTILGSQNSYKTHKFTNNWLSNFGLIEEIMYLSGTLLAVMAETHLAFFSHFPHFSFWLELMCYVKKNTIILCKDIKKLQGQCA